ncbi:hypothetical protein NDU88_006380 [Pleurodeles waltl]|uniref:Uncharacterized protein n=1 Tax=Pleurodeles waltl TaxID=8319 RepID=A0AAV7SPH1_PLEWA|nr:hypothetical protein NDU88_006380 [Pleurodeles waltl]
MVPRDDASLMHCSQGGVSQTLVMQCSKLTQQWFFGRTATESWGLRGKPWVRSGAGNGDVLNPYSYTLVRNDVVSR